MSWCAVEPCGDVVGCGPAMRSRRGVPTGRGPWHLHRSPSSTGRPRCEEQPASSSNQPRSAHSLRKPRRDARIRLPGGAAAPRGKPRSLRWVRPPRNFPGESTGLEGTHVVVCGRAMRRRRGVRSSHAEPSWRADGPRPVAPAPKPVFDGPSALRGATRVVVESASICPLPPKAPQGRSHSLARWCGRAARQTPDPSMGPTAKKLPRPVDWPGTSATDSVGIRAARGGRDRRDRRTTCTPRRRAPSARSRSLRWC